MYGLLFRYGTVSQRTYSHLSLIHISTSVIFPLFMGLIALIVRDNPKYETSVKNMIILLICLVSMFGDWGGIAVVWILIFGSRHYSRKTQMQYFCVSTAIMIVLNIIFNAVYGCWYNNLFQLGIFLAVPLLINYNGIRRSGKSYKWFFYIFYPAHLLLLAVIRYAIL